MNPRLPLYIAIVLAGLSVAAGVVFFFLSSRRPKPAEELPTAPPEEAVVRGPNWERKTNPDGSVSQTIFSTQTNYQTELGSFEPIDTTLSPTPSGDYQNTTNSVKSFFNTSEARNNIVKSIIGGVEIVSGFGDNELGSVNRQAVAEVKDNQITYKNVYPGVDVRYTILPGGVLEEFVLTEAVRNAAATLSSLTQQLSLSAGKLEKREDGSIGIFSDDGQLLGFLPLPYMYEDSNQTQFSEGITYNLVHLGGVQERRYHLSKNLTPKDRAWLADPRRQFPVAIDASVYEGQNKDGGLYRWCTGGTYLDCRNSPINTQTGLVGFYVGQKWEVAWGEWWIQRGYVSFLTESIPDDATTNSANLYLTLRHDTSDPDFDIKFYSGDWGDLDAADWDVGTVSEGVFRNTNGLSPGSTDSHSVNPASIDKLPGGETQFRFTSSREEAGNPPSGLEDISFYSANHWNANFRPRLEVTFTGANQPPNVPSNPSPSSGANNQSVFADLSWTGGDPDAGDTARYDVYLKAGDSNFGAPVSSNQTATSYDPGTLAHGTTYYWKIVAKDGFGATTTGPVWNFSTVAAPSQTTVLGNPADGFLEKRVAGGPFASCQAQMDAIKAQTPTVEAIGADHSVGFYSADCENVGWMSRMFVSFDTSAIPDGDTVYSATLYLTLENNAGIPGTTPPVVDFGVYSGGSCYGTLSDSNNPQDWLDPSDWDACGSYEGNIIENMGGVPGVSDTVYALPIHPENISKNGQTQFRMIRNFPAEDYVIPAPPPAVGESFDSYVNFYSADTFPSRRPRLVIDTSGGCSNTVPDSPTLSSPTDGAGGVSVNPTLSWNAISSWGVNCAGNNNTYEVFLSDNRGMVESMNSSASQGTVSEGTISLPVTGLLNNTTYYWRVRASNGAVLPPPTGASDVWQFTTEAAAALVPRISLDPNLVQFSITQGLAAPATQSVQIWNSGDAGSILTWTWQKCDLTSCPVNIPWFAVLPFSGGSHTSPMDPVTNPPNTLWVILAPAEANTMPVGVYRGRIRISDPNASNPNGEEFITVELTITAAAGTVEGDVYSDTDQVCPINGSKILNAPDGTVRLTMGATTLTSGTDNTGHYRFVNVPYGSGYQLTVSAAGFSCACAGDSATTPPAPATGSSGSCTKTINISSPNLYVDFSVSSNPSGWMQVRNGDVYAASVQISVPSPPPDRWFIEADPDTAGGVAIAPGVISCNTRTSERGWEIPLYSGGIGWPRLAATSGPSVNVISHNGDLTIDPAFINTNGLDSGLNVVIVNDGNLTITGDVKGTTNPNDFQIYAVLIVSGSGGSGEVKVEDNDAAGNDQLKIKGALYAENGFDIARSLSNNQLPAVVVDYNPTYLLQTIPGLTTSGVSWREVR